jgi:hypothetical protein
MTTHTFELNLRNPSAMDISITEGEVVITSGRYRQIRRRSLRELAGVSAVLAISSRNKRVYCLVKRSPIPILDSSCLLGVDTQRVLSLECGDSVEIEKIDNYLIGIFLYCKTHPFFWTRLAARLSWLALIGAFSLGLCVCMTSLLGVEVWSQNIGDSTVSIPWLVMPTLLKFQKSQKNNEA